MSTNRPNPFTAAKAHRPLIEAAISIGLPVFPCGSNKRPCIAKEDGGHGFYDASTDPAEIERLFSHRAARLIGVPTGTASGIDALDFDYRSGAKSFEDANLYRLPETRVHQTQSGGRHMLFVHAPGVRNLASKFADGMDVRGDGGYIVAPPSKGYSVISDADLVHWPDWLLQLVLPPPPAPIEPRPPSEPRELASSATIERKIRRSLDRVRNAPDGKKHDILRDEALFLGGIKEQAGFTETQAVRWLLDALPKSIKDPISACKTAQWGIEQGKLRPILIEEPAARKSDDKNDRKPDPRRKETARTAFRLLWIGVPSNELLKRLHEQNRRRPYPLSPDLIEETALWATRKQTERKIAEGANAA